MGYLLKNFLWVLFLLLSYSFTYSISSFSAENSTYEFDWLDPDKEVYVLQNRKFRKKGSPYVMAGGGITTSGAFTDGKNLQGRFGMFFQEEWGAELFISKNFTDENEAALSVKSAGVVPFMRKVQNYMGGLLLWSPFYAKINTFNKIVYFDWIFGIGFAKITEENNRNHFDAGNTIGSLTEETHTSFAWDTAWKFYINEQFSMRLDLLGQHYKARRALRTSGPGDESFYTHYDLTLSLGYAF